MGAHLSLLKLPQLVQKEIISMMDGYELMSISLCSKRSKALLKLLNRPDTHMIVQIHGKIQISIENMRELFELQCRILQWTVTSPFGGVWEHNKYKLKQWIQHFSMVFKCKKVSFIFFVGCERFRVDDIQKAFEHLEKEALRITHQSTPIITQLLTTFLPVNNLYLLATPPTSLFRQSLRHEYNELFLDGTVVFEDLHAMNCKIGRANRANLSEIEVNTFLKNWVHGSHPRLREQQLKPERRLNMVQVLDGLTPQIWKEKRRFLVSNVGQRDLEEGNLITAADGKRMRIYVYDDVVDIFDNFQIFLKSFNF
uniref:F-box domain-containing protein n=1 Tax=Caenorhabditis tropicalis TaxID=1561998 RepID=A0A1I7TLN5_9PELO